MKRKLRNIFWIALLFLVCFPAGYLFTFSLSGKYASSEGPIFNAITGGIALMFFIGPITLIAWGVAKTRGSADPLKIGLLVSSCLLFILMLISGIMYPSAATELDRKLFVYAHDEDICGFITERVGEIASENPDWAAHEEDIIMCTSVQYKHNERLLDELMATGDLHEKCMTSMLLEQELNWCYELYRNAK